MKNKLIILIVGVLYFFTSFGQSNVVFNADERLFTIFSLINTCGFDDEHSKKMSDVRLNIREELKGINPNLKAEIVDFYKKTDNVNWYNYTCYSFMLTQSPNFEVKEEYKNYDVVKKLDGFNLLLTKFYKECKIDILWEKYEKSYNKEIELQTVELKDEVTIMWEYLKIPKGNQSPINNVIVVPNLLNSYFRATQFEDTVANIVYIIPGPYSQNAPIAATVIHEMLHSITRPLLFENITIIDSLNSLNDLVKDKPTIKNSYNSDFGIVLDESIVRALTWHIVFINADKEFVNKGIQREYEEGFILIWYFYEAFNNFENNKKSLIDYYKTLISNIDINKEKQRWKVNTSD